MFEQSIEVVSPIVNQILNSVVMDTETPRNLNKKHEKSNEAFTVCGMQVHKSHLAPLTMKRDDVDFDSDLYFYGSTICSYLNILCFERIQTEVTMYTCEDIILSHSDENENEMLKCGLREFLCRKVPDYDFVIFPVCKNSHCYLIVVLTKLYIVLYLDSLGMVKRNA